MKSLTLRSSVALACALTLAGCGGGSGNLLLSGTVFGLTRDGLVLQNNGGDPYVITPGTPTFAFPTLLRNDEDYNVTVKSAPPSAVCTVANGKGRTGAFNVTNVTVTCITNTYDLGGTISGLDGAGLVLVNGADRVSVPAGAVKFQLAKVGDGSPYGVTVLSQPTNGRTCSVQNGVGTMGAAPVGNIQVTCV